MSSERKMLVTFARIVLFCFLIVLLRFFYLQTFASDNLQDKVTKQRVKEIIQLPERGQVTDRNSNILAMSLMANDIAVYPNLIKSASQQEKVASFLAKELDISKESILKKLKTGSYWAPIAQKVDPIVANRIKESGLGGIEIKQSPKRYYPNGDLAGNILGFVNQESQPGAGIEVSMNNYLAGTPGYTIAETDNMGKTIPVGFENISSPVDGQNVSLTIDSYIQYLLEKRLKKAMKEMDPVSIHAIIMNPKNGEIHAMASYPSFSPNEYDKSKPDTWNHNAAAFTYEPGSTFKPVYMAMALENGSITEKSSWYDSKGNITVNGSTIKNWDSRALGDTSLEDIIVNSSNVGMIQISNTMTNKEIVTGLKTAGFGTRTGIDLPGEEVGLFPTPQQLDDDPIRKATVSFGQGISITPVQLITAFSEVINGGHNVQPSIVRNVTDRLGNTLYEPEKAEKKRIYSQKTSDLMKTYLAANMTKGSGKDSQLNGFESGGKTGSAWIVENGRYKSGVIVGSFMGFAPLDDPEYAMLVVVNQPTGIEFGSLAAGPIFKDVMSEVLRYKGVPRKDQKNSKTMAVPNVREFTFEEASQIINQDLPDAKVIKSGKGTFVYDQSYQYDKDQLHITLLTRPLIEENTTHLPSLIGKTKTEITQLLKEHEGKIIFHGSGQVVEQSLPPGAYKTNETITLWLKE